MTCLRQAVLFLLLTLPFSASAEEVIPPSPIVKTQLLIDSSEMSRGGPAWAGVKFTMPKDWHIYWQNPGDSGIPTTYQWTLPEGLTAGDIHWPVPERITLLDIVNYGYSNEVILPVALQSSQGPIQGDITVQASWLVCHETCIPEKATLTGTIAPNADAGKELHAAVMHAPQDLTFPAHYKVEGDQVTLAFATSMAPTITAASFFPIDDGVVSNDAAQKFAGGADAQSFTLTVPRGQGELQKTLRGVLRITNAGVDQIVSIQASYDGDLPAAPSDDEPDNLPSTDVPAVPPVSFTTALILAILGGLILNIMPCVLPILALKALAIAKKAQISRSAAAKQGIAYTIGVIASFLVIAGIMLALKASGDAIGWGFQLQNSHFVAFLIFIMLAVSANLLGLFSLPVLFGTHAHEVNENSKLGSVLTGALAVMVATPCTAPFMATAIGTTLALPATQALLVFAALGFGMALPFLIISFWPAALRHLPKPGAWMHRFKQILAIPMLATAAWLIWVLVQLQSPMQLESGHLPYNAAQLDKLRDAGTPVLVDATAAWCLTCKVNERVALRPLQEFFNEKKVVVMVADWTNSDPAITQYLASFNRNGVPLVVYYPPNAEPVVLPQILTPAIVRSAIERK